ncbi:MAG: winged helix-turn-helix domain-containing protein [Streptosporangiaceae bacterium]|jgi:DNA-binding GntR family transcriptional regulator
MPQVNVWVMDITPGPVAPWRQIHAVLRAQITSGELAPGDRLPSITSLAQQYGVAMTTVRKALDALKAEGLVVTSPMGTFVVPEDERRA